MLRRKHLVCGVLAAGLAIPIIIGASCPPPDDPAFVSIITGPGSTTALPSCESGRVCISIVNQTCVDTDIILYIHNGYDLTGQYVTEQAIECCQSTTSTVPCPCFRPGSDTGELQLLPPQLFQAQNRYKIANNKVVYTVKGRPDKLSSQGGRVTVSLRCEDIKTMGLEVGMVGELPGTVQERSGPDYRCTMVTTGRGTQALPEDVACGGTLQYTIVDRNDCADVSLTVIRVDTSVSADCTTVTPTTSGTGGGGMGGGGFGG
jgi:hypothetical protein